MPRGGWGVFMFFMVKSFCVLSEVDSYMRPNRVSGHTRR